MFLYEKRCLCIIDWNIALFLYIMISFNFAPTESSTQKHINLLPSRVWAADLYIYSFPFLTFLEEIMDYNTIYGSDLKMTFPTSKISFNYSRINLILNFINFKSIFLHFN